MRAMSGRSASCRATSLPIPALAPVISTVFPGSALIVIPSHLLRVQPGWAALAGFACARCGLARHGEAGYRANFLYQTLQSRVSVLKCQIHGCAAQKLDLVHVR